MKKRYKIVYENGTEEMDHSLIDIAKNAVLDLKTKYHIIEKQLHDQRRDIRTLMYAHDKALELNLFEHGVKFISENAPIINELPQTFDFDQLKKDSRFTVFTRRENRHLAISSIIRHSDSNYEQNNGKKFLSLEPK